MMSEPKEGGSGCASSEPAEKVSGGFGRQESPGNPEAAAGMAGEMNANDIPRYNAEGYVQGRPQTAYDPTSAGRVQGAPMGESGGPIPPHPPRDAFGGSDPAAMGGNGAMGQHDFQQPPQGTAYGGADPYYGQTQPGFQQQPRGMAYGGADPYYGQAQPGFQQQPQGMAYGGADPYYGQAQPGFQQQPQGMAYGGADPYYGQAQPGFQPPPQGMAYGGGDPNYGQAQPDAEGFSAEHYGRIADVVKDIANGEQPDVNKLAALYSGFDTQFLKGALVGAVIAVLATNETVRTAVAGTIGGIFGAFKKTDSPAADAGPETNAT